MIPPDMDQQELDQWRSQTDEVQRQIELNRDPLTEEFGNFQTQVMETGRVLLIPEGEQDQEAWLICYLVQGRLILDDYVPELAENIDPNPIPVVQE